MPIYRMSFGCSGNNQGWTETLVFKDPGLDPNAYKALGEAIAQKRAAFLGVEFAIFAVRISRYSDDAGTVRQRGVALLKKVFRNPNPLGDQAAEPADVALIVNGTTNGQLGALPEYVGNKNQLFLGAPPDAAVNDAGQVDGGKANLGFNVLSWANFLLRQPQTFGWLADSKYPPMTLVNATQNASGTVALHTLMPIPNTFVPNVKYPIRISGVNNSRSALNGQAIAQVTDATVWTTKEIIGIPTAQTGGQVRVYAPVKTFLPYAELNYQLIVGNHKRGRPFDSPRGRAPRRIRG